jgi:hypothetical protein
MNSVKFNIFYISYRRLTVIKKPKKNTDIYFELSETKMVPPIYLLMQSKYETRFTIIDFIDVGI